MTSFLTGLMLLIRIPGSQRTPIPLKFGLIVFKHCQATDHNINCVREAIALKQRKPSLNKDKGLDLPAIYNPLLGLCNNLAVT